jgi:hypothetical protein
VTVRSWLRKGLLVVAAGFVASCSTCAPVQRVPIDSNPPGATIFVDQQEVGASPMEVDLRADRDHSVFLKRDGYRPQLVILESRQAEDPPRLDPAAVRVRLLPIEPGHELEVDIERRDSAPAADPNAPATAPAPR